MPYPHFVVDQFLHEDVAAACATEFPGIGTPGWTHYRHYNENKLGQTDLSAFPMTIRRVVMALQCEPFVAWLSQVTGIPGLRPDPALEGGGLHQTERGGFLNIHADFATHRHQPTWRRRCNLIIYLNPGWEESWGGALELWNSGMTACDARISPLLNRMAVFTTNDDSFHGYPDPITCPAETTRRSIALYYYTVEAQPVSQRSTTYRPRPVDSTLKSLLVRLDSSAVAVYSWLKRRFGLSDRLASSIMRMLPKRK
jgi:hypothetical protein